MGHKYYPSWFATKISLKALRYRGAFFIILSVLVLPFNCKIKK